MRVMRPKCRKGYVKWIDRKKSEGGDAQIPILSIPDDDRSIEETLSIGWDLLATLPEGELKRIDEPIIRKYHPKYRKAGE